MNYLLSVFCIIMFFLLAFRLMKSENVPNFRLMPQLSTKTFNLEINRVASECVFYKQKGGALSISLISKYIKKSYKIIASKINAGEECFDFENRIYDNYLNLTNAINRVRETGGFYRLPQVNGLPRIYRLCEVIVKGQEGQVNCTNFSSAVKRFNDIAPLTYDEICALPLMLDFCILEYVAIFASKSLKINKNIQRAYLDSKRDKLNLSLINYNSYIYGYNEFSKDVQKSYLSSFCTENGLDISTRIDNFFVNLSRYAGAMQSVVQSLLKKDSEITDKLLITLMPACDILNKNISFKQSKLPSKYVMAYYLSRNAKKEKISESAYARRVVEKAEREQKDVCGYILPTPKGKIFMRIYIAAFLLVALAISLMFAVFMKKLFILTLVFVFPLAFCLLLRINEIIVGKFTQRRYLPRKDYKYIDKTACKTMIVYTSLVGSVQEVEKLFSSLKTLKVANPDKIFCYSLLLDLPSSLSPTSKKDDEIIQAIRDKFNALRDDRFSVYLRRRIRVSDKEYRGWEKKRGALLELNNFLLNDEKTPFVLILGKKEKVKYIITLDSDTLINCAVELVEIMEHGFNCDKNVVSLNMKTNPNEIMTPFASLMSGSIGLTNYSSAMTNPNYDVFGSGNYTGKGIYRLKEFNDAVSEIFMDNRLLSHDFIEGAVAGCANSDMCGIDCFPSDYSGYLKRKIRWLRGDWQLFPYLFSKIKNRNGQRIFSPLSPIAKWHILCNIVCSIANISSLVFIFISLFTAKTKFLFIAFLPQIIAILSTIRAAILIRNNSLKNIRREFVELAMLPIDATYSFCAIIVTLIRLIRHKNLLNWNISAHSSGKISYFPNVIVAGVLLIYNAIFYVNIWFFIISLLFMSGIILDYVLSKPYKIKDLSSQTIDELKLIAKQTYSYFEDMKTPCDNYQEGLGYAKRTSPTNLGYSIVSHICAYKLGFIDEKTFRLRVDNILSFIDGLDKWRGNLYNWYSDDGSKLYPAYVSTVDNGNLAFCLILLGEEFLTYKEKVMKILNDMKLEKLFDYKRGLFFIGYNDSTKTMDGSHYDLLASESMITYLAAIVLNKIDRGAYDILSRKRVRYCGNLLYSWNGGLFEYLMSDLFVAYPRNSFLYNSAKNAINSHKKYAKNIESTIWGWSESVYKSTDDNGWYQYKPFGVKNISINNDVSSQVVSSYSSILGMRIDKKSVLKNVENLKKCRMIGKYGFYESFDDEPIKTFMTHHQGMILFAISRCVKKDIFSVFDNCDFVCAARILLSIEDDGKIAAQKINPPKKRPFVADKSFKTDYVYPPQYNFLGNGRYFVVENSCGRGYSYFDKKYINRFSSFLDGVKIKLMLDDKELGEVFAGGNAIFTQFDSTFNYQDEQIEASFCHSVFPMFNGEMRNFTFRNKTKNPIKLKLNIDIELSMTDINKDLSHKTFSQLFIKSKYDTQIDAPIFYRTDENPRLYFSTFFDKSASYSGNYEDGKKFGEFPLPMARAEVSFILEAYSKTTFRHSNIVSYDIEYLKRSISLIKTVGFDKRIEGGIYSLKRLNPSFDTASKASLIMHERVFVASELQNIFNVNCPIISFVVTGDKSFSRLTYMLKELIKLKKFGLKFNIAVICKESEGYYKLVSEGVNNIFDSLNVKTNEDGCASIVMDYDNELAKIVINNSLNADYVIHNKINHAINYSKQPFSPAPMPHFDIVHKVANGGFLANGGFVILNKPKRPWSNVIAEKNFGCIITDSGGGYTYAKNSRQDKITRHNNDIINDTPSESIFFEDKRDFWGATCNPIKKDCNYVTIHYMGSSEFYCNYNGVLSKVTIFIKNEVKYYAVTLLSTQSREISVMFNANFTLGDDNINTKNNLEFCFDKGVKVVNKRTNQTVYMQCSNPYDYTFFQEGYCDVSGKPITTNVNKNGIIPYPAISTHLFLNANEEKTIYFSLGNKTDFENLDVDIDSSRCKQISCFDVKSGIAEIDYLCKWLPYQILYSRFYSRAGYYQAGGAIGFRDQLQDCLSILYINPALVKEHIITCASHQFFEGDVQHWWHYDCTGVRTKIMDDRLYLPLVVAEYISFTKDSEILDILTPYLNDVSILDGAGDVYATPKFSTKKDTIYNHCIKAITSALQFSEKSLLLMGGGDWNDGMNKVGIKGKGSTVWGSMFAFYVIDKFYKFCDKQDKKVFDEAKEDLRRGINDAYNGSWFLRAYADDGSILGNADCEECKIDLITQAFAVISGAGDETKAKSAMDSAEQMLVDRQNGIIKLLDPPLKKYDAGYISLYPAGIRENGGQYTHGAIWYIWALFEMGEYEKAYDMLQMINPVYKCREGGDGERYKIEPYVMSADVYAGENIGQGGWSWYTGSASWYYKCIIEQLLGISIKGEVITFAPKLSSKIKDVIKIDYTNKYGVLKIEIDNSGNGDFEMKVDKIKYSSPSIKLSEELVKHTIILYRKNKSN